MEHLNQLNYVIPSSHLSIDIAIQIPHILALLYLQKNNNKFVLNLTIWSVDFHDKCKRDLGVYWLDLFGGKQMRFYNKLKSNHKTHGRTWSEFDMRTIYENDIL